MNIGKIAIYIVIVIDIVFFGYAMVLKSEADQYKQQIEQNVYVQQTLVRRHSELMEEIFKKEIQLATCCKTGK